MSNPRQLPVGRSLRLSRQEWCRSGCHKRTSVLFGTRSVTLFNTAQPEASPYPPETHTEHCSGFTLIELITSIMALMVVVTAVTLLFASSKRSAEIGMTRTGVSADAAAAISILRQDLAQAVCTPTLTMAMSTDLRVSGGILCYDSPASELCFVRLNDNTAVTNARLLEEMTYWVRETTNGGAIAYELVRGFSAVSNSIASNNCFHTPEWYADPPTGEGRPTSPNAEVIARNVAGFELSASRGSGVTTNAYKSASSLNLLPGYIDVFLEVLDDQAVRQAAGMPNMERRKFIDRVATRYSARIFLPNRAGYVR